MSTHRRTRSSRIPRPVWGGIAGVLAVALVASVYFSRSAVDDAELEAEARAVDWASTVLFDAVEPEQLDAPILGRDYGPLLITVQAGILSDDRAVRVRLWSTEGLLVFSSDQRDKIGEFEAKENPQIAQALDGQTVSVPTQTTVAPRSGLAGSDEKLYQTFVPLRLVGQLGVAGVGQIDQRYEMIEGEARDVWRTVQIVLAALLLVSLVMVFVSQRRRLEPATVGAPSGEEVPSRRQIRAAERAAAKAEEEVRAVLERAERAEAAIEESESVAAASRREIEDLEERLARAEERASSAEAAALDAAQRATGGEPVRRGVPGVGSVAVAAAAGGEEVDRELLDERDQLAGEVSRLRAALTERDAEVALLRESAGGDGGEEAERALAAERLAEEATRTQAAESRVAELEGRVEELAAALALAEASGEGGMESQGTPSELRQAQLDLTGLQLKLAETESALEEAQAQVSEHEQLSTDLRAQQERTLKELEAARTALAKGDAEVEAARQALAARDEDDVASLIDRAAASEAAAQEATTKLAEAESALEQTRAELTAAQEATTKLAEAESALEQTRAELVAAQEATTAVAASKAAVTPSGDVEELEARIEELESQRRADVSELQHAQETLANTQYEAAAMRNRVKELEEELRRRASEVPEVPAAETPAPRELSPLAARLAGLAPETEPEPERVRPPAREEEPEAPTISEEGMSLRERLARAAAARHRAPGAPPPDES